MEFREYLEAEKVGSVEFRRPISVSPESSIREAVRVMQEERAGCLLVTAGDELVGIFTERDLLRDVLGRASRARLDDPVATVMTPDPVVARTDEVLAVVFRRMWVGGFRHLPLLDREGRLLGTMSIERVVRFLADHFAETVYNLPPEPGRFGSTREGA